MQNNTPYFAAHKIQAILLRELSATPDLAAIAREVGYSERHCMRLFKQATGHTIPEYHRLLRLTGAAEQLLGSATVLDTALDGGFESHEGFTKAFRTAFGITPKQWKKRNKAIPLFVPFPIHPPEHFAARRQKREADMNTIIPTATFVERPARKLVYLPSKTATDYFSFCEENGCEFHGMLGSMPGALDLFALITLPEGLTPEGYGNVLAGVELPLDSTCEVPEGYHALTLPATTLLMLSTHPYTDPDAYCDHLDLLLDLVGRYDPAPFGYHLTETSLPLYNFGADEARGGRIGFPVEKAN